MRLACQSLSVKGLSGRTKLPQCLCGVTCSGDTQSRTEKNKAAEGRGFVNRSGEDRSTVRLTEFASVAYFWLAFLNALVIFSVSLASKLSMRTLSS